MGGAEGDEGVGTFFIVRLWFSPWVRNKTLLSTGGPPTLHESGRPGSQAWGDLDTFFWFQRFATSGTSLACRLT